MAYISLMFSHSQAFIPFFPFDKPAHRFFIRIRTFFWQKSRSSPKNCHQKRIQLLSFRIDEHHDIPSILRLNG